METKLLSYFRPILFLWLLAICIATASCKKSSQAVTNSTSITRTIPKVTDYQVTGADLDSILALFQANSLSIANLQFQSYTTYYSTGIAPGYPGSPGYIGPAEQVLATQFFNGLPAWAGGYSITFNGGIFTPAGKYNGYTGPAPNDDLTTQQTLSDLRHAFLAHIGESGFSGGLANSAPKFPYTASMYADSCLLVTLGYMDASTIPGNTTPSETALVKVWQVTPLSGGLPRVNVEDDNGLAWGVVVYLQ